MYGMVYLMSLSLNSYSTVTRLKAIELYTLRICIPGACKR